MRTRMYGGVRGRKTKIGGKPTFVFLLLDFLRLSDTKSLKSCLNWGHPLLVSEDILKGKNLHST